MSDKKTKYLIGFAVIFILVLVASLLGILTRPLSHSAFLWPANAILLGMLIRFISFRHIATLIGAACAYVVADLSTGGTLIFTIALTIINFISVLLAFYVFIKLSQHQLEQRKLHYTKPYVPYLAGALVGSSVSAFVAVFALPYVPHTFMPTEQYFVGFLNWWSGEMFNYVIFLPLMMTFPRLSKLKQHIKKKTDIFLNSSSTIIIPFFAVIVSCVLTHFFFAPGALLYPLATIIWAATLYRIFSIAVINALVCLTLFHSLTHVYLSSAENDFIYPMVSIRIGLIILAMTTLFICAMSLNRRRLFAEMEYLAHHDVLTNAISRQYFFEKGEKILKNQQSYPIAVIMLDIDHFKRFNDRYGHHNGDLALQHFARIVQKYLGEKDLFCRIGGDEFVILLNQTTLLQTNQIAKQIRAASAHTALMIDGKAPLYLTASLGIRHQQEQSNDDLEQLMNQANHALLQARQSQPNQFYFYTQEDGIDLKGLKI